MRARWSVAALLAALISAGCTPCGDSPTAITGTVDGEDVALCSACFGVTTDLGSHQDQLTGAPVSHRVSFLFTRSGSGCDQVDPNESEMPAGSIELAYLELGAGLHHSDYFFAYDVAGHRFLLGSGDMEITVARVENLPGREEGFPPYPEVDGLYQGSVEIELAISSYQDPDDGKKVGRVSGSFQARHCENIDSAVLE